MVSTRLLQWLCMTAWPLQQSQSDSNDNDDGQLDDADSPGISVPTAAVTVGTFAAGDSVV